MNRLWGNPCVSAALTIQNQEGRKTYIESHTPNYTFTSLDEGDYLVTAYVKDTAGNESEIQAQSTSIRYTSFCLKNDITDFGDCLIATEAQNSNIDEAKTFIESKGTPDFNKTSPSVIYDEKHATNLRIDTTTSTRIYIGTGYTFDEETGMYTITGGGMQNPNELDINSDTTYYTNFSAVNNNVASYVVKIANINSQTDDETGIITTTMTTYLYTQTPRSYNNLEGGMYFAKDNDGNSYYYRGSVASNYVKFGGYYWRVIRVNGDGTVRMIYDGTSPHANGESTTDRRIGNSQFNSYFNDNTYVGYMYADPNNFVETNSGSTSFRNSASLSATAQYVFGTSYTLDKNNRGYKVSGDIIQGTIAPDKVGYYTCFSTDKDNVCQKLYFTTEYYSSTAMEVRGVGYGTTSKQQAQSNDTDSTIKTYLDNWYQNNLNGYTDKLSQNTIFCNNRNISEKVYSVYNNLGYGINPTIYGYERFINYANQGKLGPTLSCSLNDSFNVNDSKGNDKLTYPIGLITMDEVNMAGGINGSTNTIYYLYSGNQYWTMSPSDESNWFTAAGTAVTSYGEINRNGINNEYGVRPVINLDPDKITFTGNGTMQDPYVIS